MGGYRLGQPSWIDPDFYPVQDLLVKGGNLGHDLEEFRRKHPATPGRLVLQDLRVVIGQIKELDEKIEPMAHDFFTEQPIKGTFPWHHARAYYMHLVLHDWPQRILPQLTVAMKPSYSKLLISENVIPDTEAEWQSLLEQAASEY
ncbi:hypothetical protein H2201_006471 [Coniosporium apollinis]|uniref:O-methyltransferase domain-containing protein n=1 Tax=Coniosporium apollinis TaxID=61459 RepID=A0ABQ9NLY1_9PEZI|nr:hypothetical protein H2201_006471 [Coniosporium apollinis]